VFLRSSHPRPSRLTAAVLLLVAVAWAIGSRPGQAQGTGTAAEASATAAQAEMLGCIQRGEGRQALLAARRAVESKRHAQPDSLAVAQFMEDLGTQFVIAEADSLRPLGLPLLLQALEWRRRAAGERSATVAAATNVLSTYYYLLGRFDEAAEWEHRSLAVLESTPGVSDSLLAFTRRDLGLIYYQLGRYAEARDLFKSGLPVFEHGPNQNAFLAADLNNCLGEIMRLEVRYADSQRYFSRATQLLDSLIANESEATLKLTYERFSAVVWLNRANLLYEQSRYDEAEARYRWVVNLLETKGSEPMALPHAYLNVAEICRFQGRYAEAEAFYTKALELARKEAGPDNPDTFWFQHSLAELFAEQGRDAEAEAAYRDCIRLLERAGTAGAARIGMPLRSLANLLRERRRYDEAEPLYRRSMEAYNRVLGAQSPELARSKAALARCLFDRPNPDFKTAQTLTQEALQVLDATRVFPEAQLEALLLSAEILHQQGDTRHAREVLATAVRGAETLRRVSSVDEHGRAAFFADYAPAFEKMVAWTLEQGDVPAAIEFTERFRARVLLEQMRLARVDVMAGLPDSLRVQLEHREHKASLDLAQAERQLALLQQQPGANARDDSLRTQDLLRARDAGLEKLRVVQDEARRRSPLWSQAVASGDSTVSLAQMQGELTGASEAWLLYHVGAETSHAIFVPKKGAPQAFALQIDSAGARVLGVAGGPVTRDKLGRILLAAQSHAGAPTRGVTRIDTVEPAGRSVMELLENPDRPLLDGEQACLHALWNALVPAALQSQVRRLERVVIVPDGVLHRLPFEALVLETPRRGAASTYWLERGPIIRYAPSATVLWTQARMLRQRPGSKTPHGTLSVSDAIFERPPAGAAAAAGDPPGQTTRAGGSGTLPRLPGTRVESQRITAAFGASAVVLLEGPDATEARVRRALPGKRYIHLATHGIVESRRDDLYAALALTPGAPGKIDRADDGFLELSEIYGLQLDADLVVLSACSTHQGSWVEGDGIFALTRGCLAAGCPRVIGSLWNVADASTAEMIGDLFAAIAAAEQGHDVPDFSRALRDARLRLLKSRNWNHPFYWAPFVFLGQR